MTLLATIRKNSREEIRVSLDDFKGHHLVNLRVFYFSEDGEARPGKQGLAFRLELLPAIMEALNGASDRGDAV